MRRILLISLLLISTLAYSVPAKRITKTVIIDGKEVKLTFTGNEKVHFWLSEDGKKYQQDDDGNFIIFPESSYLKAANSRKYEMKNPESAIPNTPAFAKARAKRKAKYQGQKRGLLILVEFADNTFTSTTNPKEDYQNIASAENFKESRNYGSVRDYFKAQSYGQFDFVLDVVGPIKLSHNMNYYGANDSYGEDLRPGTMVWEACRAADAEVDFSDYDWDGDGEVEHVFVLYAGYGEAQSHKKNTVWPHAWSLSMAKEWESEIGSCVFDGVNIDSYACGNELAGESGGIQDGIGTICHEFSHCFGLPDLYCTDSSHTDMTMEEWSILDFGSYVNNSYTPVSYTAYERWFCGWIEPTELSSPQYVKDMANIDLNGESYIIYNDGNRNEYYILQNIQREGWNSYAPGHGMLILHVDYDPESWVENTINNDRNHLRLAPICADNRRNVTSYGGDPYPGTSRNTQLTDDSTPSASLFNANTDGKKLMHKPITDIAESTDGIISFTFMGGIYVAPPTDLAASMSANEITATWNETQEGIVSYNLKYGSVDKGEAQETVIIDEDFSKVTSNGNSNNDISSMLDEWLNTPGFTGTKLYADYKGLKMGSSKLDGELISPVLSGITGDISMILSSETYGTDNCMLTVNVYKSGETNPFYTSEPLEAGKVNTLKLSKVPDRFIAVIGARKRCYLTKLQIIGNSYNPYSNETEITGITSMPYTFSPAFEAEQYWMQIQAVGSEGKASGWSDRIIFGNSASKIDNATSTPLHGERYNLNGQRVGMDFKGIIIRNGKKYMNK